MKRDYIKYWKEHQQRLKREGAVLSEMAMGDAKKIAHFLRENYRCGDVYLIGSLLDRERFSASSDIDLVVKGLPKQKYFSMLAEIRDITQFSVDVIPYEDANKLMREVVEKEGICLCVARRQVRITGQ